MSSNLNAHFAISPLLYDHTATWDSREGLDAGSLHAGAEWNPNPNIRGLFLKRTYAILFATQSLELGHPPVSEKAHV